MKVYRVEDRDGGGPYNGEYQLDPYKYYTIDGPRETMRRNPPPDEDIEGWSGYRYGGFGAKYKFGFSSIKQLYDWFPPHIIKRAKLDQHFLIAEYELESPEAALLGRHQVAFDAGRAKRVVTKPLSTSTPVDGQGELGL